jgi:hypothetical protein
MKLNKCLTLPFAAAFFACTGASALADPVPMDNPTTVNGIDTACTGIADSKRILERRIAVSRWRACHACERQECSGRPRLPGLMGAVPASARKLQRNRDHFRLERQAAHGEILSAETRPETLRAAIHGFSGQPVTRSPCSKRAGRATTPASR